MHLRGLLSCCSFLFETLWFSSRLSGSCIGVDSCAVAGLCLKLVVYLVYSLVLLVAVRLEPKWHRFSAICDGSAWAASGFSWYYLS